MKSLFHDYETRMHDVLCEKAYRWLRSHARCNPALQGIASCSEIPDAIGWTSMYCYPGQSIVIECKTSRQDFLGDRKKYKMLWKEHEGSPKLGIRYSARNKKDKEFQLAHGYKEIDIPSMGGHRYFLCPPDVASVEDIAKYYPDHGLLHWNGKRIIEVMPAPERQSANYSAETRFLRFALIHLTDNLSSVGISLDLIKATKMMGRDGISLPQKMEVA